MLTRRNNGFRFPRAFTLIEFLVVVSIMAIVASAVFSTFSGGINVYKRVKDLGTGEMQALLSLEEVERDLRNTFVISGINFTGEAKEVAFAGLVNAGDWQENPGLSAGEIRYYFDDKLKCLIKEERGYAYAISGNSDLEPKVKILSHLKGLTFSYYYVNFDTQKYEWQPSCNVKGGLPLAVGIETEFLNGTKTIKVNRIVFIPVAG